MIDPGIDVRFANEDLDLTSRGGRLSADIQAVIAADYIRNLQEEAMKGFYGWLKQGVYLLPAPIEYLDKGKGKSKEIDPEMGPLVLLAFELYASNQFTLETLSWELFRIELRNKEGNRVTISGLAGILSNPFYTGLIHTEIFFKGDIKSSL